MSLLAILSTVLALLDQLPFCDSQEHVTKYHSTNFVPSLEDVQSIRDLISDRETQLASLNSEIFQVDNVMERLRAARTVLVKSRTHVEGSLRSHKTLVSAVRRLPAEIMGEIFIQCLPCEHYIRPRVEDCPLLLTRVCRSWRTIALSVPQLWCSLSVSLQKATGHSSSPYEAWLARAKSLPLSIGVIVDDNDALAGVMKRHQPMNWLRPYITRCRDLWVATTNGNPFCEVLQCTPSLERLQLTGCRLPNEGFVISDTATRLRTLCLRFVGQDVESLATLNPPWARLTDLTLTFSNLSGQSFLRVLQSCPLLERLSLSLVSVNDADITPIRQSGCLHHPSIRRIEIRVSKGFDILLDGLTLPLLQELEVCFCGRDSGAWPHSQFKSFLIRSLCPLERLVVRCWKKLCPSHLVEYTEILPLLQARM